MSIIIALLIFGVIVVVHEFGHFIVARKNGILVEEFAIGMGPLIYGKKKGDTLYSIRALPLGGYCKMLGEDSSDYNEGSFNNKKVFQRIAVISAGSIMNFLLSFIIVFILISVNGFSTLTVRTVLDNSPAATSGLQSGDTIIRINDRRLRIFEDVHFAFMNNGGSPVTMTINRDGEIIAKEVTPVLNNGRYMIGFSPQPNSGFFSPSNESFERAGLIDTLVNSFWTIVHYIRLVLFGLIQLFTFNVSIDDMAGPVGIVTLIDDAYQANRGINIWGTISQMATLAALISANLGVFNLVPFPALDGGRLIFLLVEAVRGKPVNPEREGMFHLIGFIMLMVLAVVVTFNDISRLF